MEQLAAKQQLTKIKGSILVALSAGAFGLMPILAKFAYNDGANPFNFLTFRFGLAAVILTLIAVVKGERLRLTLREYLYLAGLGVGGYSVVAGCYFMAITKIPVSITSLILYTYPIMVTVYTVVTGVEKFEFRKAFALAISFIGIVLILNAGLRGLDTLGLLLALGSAVFYASYIIASNKLLKTISPLITTTFMIWAAAITFAVFSLITGKMHFDLGYTAWISIAGITLVSTVLGILFFLTGLEVTGPSQASILSTLEPFVTVVLSFALFSEKLSTGQITGGGFIIIAAILLQLPRKTRNSEFSEKAL